MSLRTLRADLVLLAGVVAHPVRQWRRWRALAIELFRDGGATIVTPPAAEHDPVGAMTVIQADGDVLVFVDEASLLDEQLLGTHVLRVGDWYERSRAAVRQALVALRALALGAGVAVAAAGGLLTERLVSRAAGLVAFSVLLPLGGWLFGLVASAAFRRRIDGVLRQLGVAG